MQNKRYITAITLSLLLVTTLMNLAKGSIVPGKDHEPAKIMPSIIERHESLVFAENESNDPVGEENSKTESTRNDSESDGGSKTGSTDSSTQVKPAPRKSFVPSEKIPAEQAVDFPVDI